MGRWRQHAIIIVLFIGSLAGCATENKAMAPGPPPDDSTPIRTDMKEFMLGPGDDIEVSVWRYPDLGKVSRVSPSGFVHLPLVGSLAVAGKDVAELQNLLMARYHDYFVDPQVTVSVRAIRSQKIFVLGEVSRAGVFPVDEKLTALDAIAKAGGFTIEANQSKVLLVRKGSGSETLVYPLDLEKAMNEGDMRQDASLKPGDVIYVPPLTMVDVARFSDRLTRIIMPMLAIESAFSTFEDIVIKWPLAKNVIETGKVLTTGNNNNNTIIVTPR